MNLSKQLTVVAGILALVALSYFGFGLSSKHNVAMADEHGAKLDLTSDKVKLGYTVGTQIGRDLQLNSMEQEIDVKALAAAITDVFEAKTPQMTDEEMVAAQQAFQQKKQAEFEALAGQNQASGDAYLEENKAKEGVKVTESGLQYEVLREGKGAKPTATDTVRVHYLGTLTDGTPFDSSYARNQPADFPVNAVIPGFSEGLQLMQEGAKYRFVIPSQQAYGIQGPPSIGPNQALIFEVELIELINKEQPAADAG